MLSVILPMQFAPGLRISLFALFFLPVFVALGFWQLDRAEQKETLLTAFEAKRQAPPVSIDEALATADPNFTRVQLSGEFAGHKAIYLENRLRQGQLGVETLVPLEQNGEWVMVNLGWQPLTAGQTPPELLLPEQVALTGYLYSPDKPRFVLSDIPSQTEPLMVARFDAAQFAQHLGGPVLPWQLRADPSTLTFDTTWPVSVTGPEKHQGYAFQWFAMAAALWILYLVVGFRRGS